MVKNIGFIFFVGLLFSAQANASNASIGKIGTPAWFAEQIRGTAQSRGGTPGSGYSGVGAPKSGVLDEGIRTAISDAYAAYLHGKPSPEVPDSTLAKMTRNQRATFEGLLGKNAERIGDRTDALTHYAAAFSAARSAADRARWAAALAICYQAAGDVEDSKKALRYARIAMRSTNSRERLTGVYQGLMALGTLNKAQKLTSDQTALAEQMINQLGGEIGGAMPRIYLKKSMNHPDFGQIEARLKSSHGAQ